MTRTIGLLAPFTAACALVLVLAAAGAQGSPGPASATTAATGTSGASGTTAAPTATVSACHPDAVPANRYAIFASQTVAQSVPGTFEMAVYFELQERSASADTFSSVDATGFGVWVSSQPHVGIFTYNHEVTALPAPAAFRVLVRARWFGHHRRVLHQSAALSPICVQPLLVPDLVIGRVSNTPGTTPGTAQYSVEVRNMGKAPAAPFTVSLTIGTTALPMTTVDGLAPGAGAATAFTGPDCAAGSTLTAAADPSGQIAEPADPRRSRTLSCPVP